MGRLDEAAESRHASPFHNLAEEAVSGKETSDDDEDLELKAERALACPCVAELREGPCGKAFSEAFVCFIKSTAEHKGSDCVDSFLTMQECMLENPNAFSRHESRDAPEEHKGDNALPPSTVSKG